MWNKERRVTSRPTSCNADCRKGFYCDQISTDEFEQYACMGATKKGTIKDHALDSLFNYLADPWMKQSRK
jgi:hypothetical protein